MIDADFVLQYKTQGRQAYTVRDVMLYALGVGATAADEDRFFVDERSIRVIPSMAVILAREAFWLDDPRTGIDMSKLLQGEQTVLIHNPLVAKGDVTSKLSVQGLYDKGPDKGAILDMRRELFDTASGLHLATIGIRSMLRGNGGFGGSDRGLPVPHPVPSQSPDKFVTFATRPEQALIYRLSGDYNPIHVDSTVAQRAGFTGPILHGLCTYGVATRAVLRALLNDDVTRLRRIDARFSSPVYPGETIVTEIWLQGANQAAFRCRVAERGTVVLQNGFALFD